MTECAVVEVLAPRGTLHIITDDAADTVEVITEGTAGTVEVITAGPPGPAGPPGTSGEYGVIAAMSFVHTETTPSTVWTVTHNLGFNPAGITVVSADGFPMDGFGVQYLSAGVSLRLSFDIGVAGAAYLS